MRHGTGLDYKANGAIFEKTWINDEEQTSHMIQGPSFVNSSDDKTRKNMLIQLDRACKQPNHHWRETPLEQFDNIQKVVALIQKNQNVANWDVEDVVAWLATTRLLIVEGFVAKFKESEVDGYTLLTMNEHDMIVSLGISNANERR
jgi:hypothetical protein